MRPLFLWTYSELKSGRVETRRSPMGGIYRRVKLRVSTPCYGNAYATYASPDFVPNFPPPAAMTTYCFPRTANVLGVA